MFNLFKKSKPIVDRNNYKKFLEKITNRFYWFKERNKEELFIVIVIATIIFFQFLSKPSSEGDDWRDEYRQMQLEESINI